MIKGIKSSEDGENVELVDINHDKSYNLSCSSDTWTCESIVPRTLPLTCYIPEKLLIYLRSLENLLTTGGLGSVEFGVFLKGSFENGCFYVDDDLTNTFIPKQSVTSHNIDFKEESPDGLNGVVHRHPTGCKSFSGTDSKFINSNFEFSLLYEGNKIVDGIFNLTTNGLRIQLPLRPQIIYPTYHIDNPEDVFQKIEKKKTTIVPSKKKSKGGLKQPTIPFNFSHNLDIEDEDEEDETEFVNDLYYCNHCESILSISEFPILCQDCQEMLTKNDVEKVDDFDSIKLKSIEEDIEDINDDELEKLFRFWIN